ncbi:hypothetical protein ACQR1H_28345 [Bradyrhizobium sp. HKCCYLRH2015]|uniref:hypothetical protein n=1 Tax=unclassified Bradyrhizobium TaxID=2631580 RepID=UPI0028F0966E|nr:MULTISPECIES: hypothetical protein [unclassified Bradyrhizobium]
MSRRFIVSIVMLLLLVPALATAAPSHKRKAHRWQGYGFLPGYKQPPNNSLPLYADKEAMRNGPPRGSRRHWYIDGTPKYMLYNGEWHYFGQPGFYRGHYNGGSFGPCWTRTPVGMVWTCG